MSTVAKIPRILKVEQVKGHLIRCMFNNGESRVLDFKRIFTDWGVAEGDAEYLLMDAKALAKVKLRNGTLSWPGIAVKIPDENGIVRVHPYEIGPDVLHALSEPGGNRFGSIIRAARLKAGLTQEQLAVRSGTTRFYISRIENDRATIELYTLRKIVEAGLGKRVRVSIE